MAPAGRPAASALPAKAQQDRRQVPTLGPQRPLEFEHGERTVAGDRRQVVVPGEEKLRRAERGDGGWAAAVDSINPRTYAGMYVG